ncbi:hypothetical protein [Chloroflexus sp.]|uniref:hypothetical protein n=1 Tax=Chloroflexus sp. TaxID=1904827 RepID=UPI00298EF858|nr:hypothetical protein [Chloroflexus sp.]MDW8404406.1 hypothetical protein [Chloroflexus sp.]
MDALTWPADDELCALLRRYYQGDAGLWPEILARVEDELRARQLPPEPRHVRFRRVGDRYVVMITPAQ